MKIIVYGLGKEGCELVEAIRRFPENNVELTAVTDTYLNPAFLHKEMSDLFIAPAAIQGYKFDYIIITPEKFYDEIRNRLLGWGIEKDKIVSLKKFGAMLKQFYCSLCGNYPAIWKDIGMEYEIFRRISVAGAGRRKGGCPFCGSSDRERFLYAVIKRYTKLLDGSSHAVLHFAPEEGLSKKIRCANQDRYISVDIIQGRADAVADITDLPFHDGQFDYIICSHVMEHIDDEKKAFSEVGRCLAEDGFLILTVPVCWAKPTFEDRSIICREERIRFYGQEDHVRLYGNDVVERVKQFGFDVMQIQVGDIMGGKERIRQGLTQGDSVFLCKKK